jgi:hypothetical protein
MSDVLVAPYREASGVDIAGSFAIGAGPSIDDAVLDLEELVEDKVVDEGRVACVAWMRDWEAVIFGEPRKHWKRRQGGETIKAICAPKELERILASMQTLRPHVAEAHLASWDELATFLRACGKDGGTVCLWCG